MEKVFITLGEWGEIQIDAMQISVIEAVAAVDRAGRPMLPPTYDKPTFDGSTILLNNGQRIKVPQSVDEIMEAVIVTTHPLSRKES